MSSILTLKNRVWRAYDFKQQSNLYLAIGRTTPWTDENNPDVPVASQTEVEELQFIKKIVSKYLIVPDSTGEIEVSGVIYRAILDDDIYTDLPTMVYLVTNIYYNDFCPTSVTFRQIGVLSNPSGAGGVVLTGLSYLPASVVDQGILHYVNNRTPVTRSNVQTEQFGIIIAF